MMTAQQETFAGLMPELKSVIPQHYEELSLHQFHGIPLNPQFDIYLDRELRGELLTVTLRENGDLAGYFIGFVAPGLHYRDCLTLQMDIFYVVPSNRGQKGGIMLFSEVKRLAEKRGIKAWFVGNKEHSKVHATALFEAMGFEKSETYYCMWLGE